MRRSSFRPYRKTVSAADLTNGPDTHLNKLEDSYDSTCVEHELVTGDRINRVCGLDGVAALESLGCRRVHDTVVEQPVEEVLVECGAEGLAVSQGLGDDLEGSHHVCDLRMERLSIN